MRHANAGVPRHVRAAAARDREDAAADSGLLLPDRDAASGGQARAGAAQSIRSRRAADALQHGTERDHRRRQQRHRRDDWRGDAARGQLRRRPVPLRAPTAGRARGGRLRRSHRRGRPPARSVEAGADHDFRAGGGGAQAGVCVARRYRPRRARSRRHDRVLREEADSGVGAARGTHEAARCPLSAGGGAPIMTTSETQSRQRPRSLAFFAVFAFSAFSAAFASFAFSLNAQSAKPRARDLGIAPGVHPPGALDAITDVAGVRVGHTTVVEGDRVRTGVTAILPHGGNVFQAKVAGAVFVGNAFGKLAGSTQVAELGTIETPIVLTNTLSLGTAVDAVARYTIAQPGNDEVRSVNPLVGETNDGGLNGIRGFHVTREHVLDTIPGPKSGSAAAVTVGA